MKSWFRQKYRWCERFISYGLNGANSYDWCADYLYKDIALRLERCYFEFKDHGHCMWNSYDSNQMRKLKEAYGLAKELSSGEDDHRYSIEVMEKYRVGDIWDNNYSIPEEMFRFYFKKACEKDDRVLKYKKDRLFYLIRKYLDGWWD